MKRILISQRRDRIVGRDEERDATDVRIGKILFDFGFLPIFLCSEIEDHLQYLTALQPDGFLLGSGNDIGECLMRDSLETSMLDYAEHHKLPVFAICRGTQMLNAHQGGKLERIDGHVASRITLVGEWAEQHGYYQVNSFHNFGIDSRSLGKNITILAKSADGVIKAIRHDTLPWVGIMWHPERELSLSNADSNLIKSVYLGKV